MDWLRVYTFRALNRLEPATIEELISDVRSQAATAGILPAGQIAKIDRVLVGRDIIANWERAAPPLVTQVDYNPSEISSTGNVLPGAQSRFALTEDGEQEMRRVERRGGLLD